MIMVPGLFPKTVLPQICPKLGGVVLGSLLASILGRGCVAK